MEGERGTEQSKGEAEILGRGAVAEEGEKVVLVVVVEGCCGWSSFFSLMAFPELSSKFPLNILLDQVSLYLSCFLFATSCMHRKQ